MTAETPQDVVTQLDIPAEKQSDVTLNTVLKAMIDQGIIPRPWRPRDGDSRCQWCGHANPVWWSPDDLWNTVMFEDRAAIVCPPCFIKKAESFGYGLYGAWQVYPPARLED